MNWVRRKTWIGVILIAIGLLGWWIREIKTNAETKAVTQAKTTVTLPRHPTQRQWEYGFTKPPWMKGLNPSLREDRYRAKILYYDEGRFDFDIYLPTPGRGATSYYRWLRTVEPSGKFTSSDRLNHGTWFLKPDRLDENNSYPISFHGSEVNKNGEQMEIWLRAVD